jgi:hypothetical protein
MTATVEIYGLPERLEDWKRGGYERRIKGLIEATKEPCSDKDLEAYYLPIVCDWANLWPVEAGRVSIKITTDKGRES